MQLNGCPSCEHCKNRNQHGKRELMELISHAEDVEACEFIQDYL